MQELPRRILLSHAPSEAYTPMSRAILAKLGYAVLTEDEFEAVGLPPERQRPDLRIVDERNLAEVPEDAGGPVPILVLTGRHGVTGADPRIAGAMRRPAGLHELYSLAQQVLEDVPRSVPRVATHLSARCNRRGREWSAALLSLSENGCLLRTPEPMLLGSRVDMRFELPRSGLVALEAECAYQLLPDIGMVFHAATTAVRQAVQDYVTEALAAL